MRNLSRQNKFPVNQAEGLALEQAHGDSQMARAWAMALLRRNGEDLNEENIARVLEQRPTFGAIVRRPGATPAKQSSSSFAPPFPPPFTPPTRFRKPDPAVVSLAMGHQLHDPDTAMARAWATAQLRRGGETITEENIQRILAAKKSPGVPKAEPVQPPDLPVNKPAREPRSEEDRTQLLEGRLRELRAELREQQEALEESRRREEKLRQRNDAWHTKVCAAENMEDEVQQLKAELNTARMKIEQLSNRVEEGEVEKLLQKAEQNYQQEQRDLLRQAEERESGLRSRIAELEQELAKARENMRQIEGKAADSVPSSRIWEMESAWRTKLEKSRVESQKALEEMAERLAQQKKEVQEMATELDRSREELAAANRNLERAAKDRTVPAASGDSSDEAGELERLRLLVSELSGFEREPGLESRKVLIETLENELTLCLQREATLQGRARELDSPETNPSAPPAAEGERERLQTSVLYLRKRINSLSALIAESLAFLRRREDDDSDNDQADN